KALYPALNSMSISPLYPVEITNTSDIPYIAYLRLKKIPSAKEKVQIRNWLQTKLSKNVRVIFDK
ncbi:MAG: hypothetical protein ABIQ02_05305, partial [Saprospiraceae bacterium]